MSSVKLEFGMFLCSGKCVIKKNLWKSFHFLANVSDDVYRMIPDCIVDKVIVWCVWDEEEDDTESV